MAVLGTNTRKPVSDSSADLNKTEITLRVTEGAAQWLEGIGAKAIETEVYVAQGWIADLAAFWVPTMTEATRTKLIPKSPPYAFGGSKAETDEENRRWKEKKDAYANLPHTITIAHEVKTSRSDFKRDTKWACPPVADMQVISYVRGIIGEHEIPQGWWGLEHASTGKLLKVRKREIPLVPVSGEQRLILISNLADRLHNRQANKFFRDLQKSHRDSDRKSRTLSRVSNCMSAVVSILKGDHESVEGCLKYHLGWDEKVPQYQAKDLENLFGKLKEKKEKTPS